MTYMLQKPSDSLNLSFTYTRNGKPASILITQSQHRERGKVSHPPEGLGWPLASISVALVLTHGTGLPLWWLL